MLIAVKLTFAGIVILLGAIGADQGHDLAFRINSLVLIAAAAAYFIWTMRADPYAVPDEHIPDTGYMNGVVRAGVIATALWGVVGFLAGTYIAFQLAFPVLNLDLPYTSFGRLRPLHTSAVIFAFGGNALIATSFYIVQRTCAARLWGGETAWWVFWGYQLVIVLAATSYVFGGSEGKEYAELPWHVDLLLTVVWVAYLLVFLGTLIKRKEPHIYVANWFFLAFIVTVAASKIDQDTSEL